MDKLKSLANSPIWDQGYTKNIYIFPLPTNKDFSKIATELAKGEPVYNVGPFLVYRSPESHIGPYKWAIDFLVPDGTEILAAKEGLIIEAVDNFNEWGPTEKFRDKLNYITLQHSNGEYSQYCHLALNSFQNTGLKVGDYVEKDQLIALVGKTGWTDRDHLHFIVFRTGNLPGSPFGFYSLQVRFKTT